MKRKEVPSKEKEANGGGQHRILRAFTIAIVPLIVWGLYLELSALSHCRATKEDLEWLHTAETDVGRYLQCFLRPRLANMRATTKMYFPEEQLFPRWRPLPRFGLLIWQFLCLTGGLIYLWRSRGDKSAHRRRNAILLYTVSQVLIFIGGWYSHYRWLFYLAQLAATFAALHFDLDAQWDGNSTIHFAVGAAVLAFILLFSFSSWKHISDTPQSSEFIVPTTALDLLCAAFTLPVVFFTKGDTPTTVLTAIIVGVRTLLFRYSFADQVLGLFQFPLVFRDLVVLARSWGTFGFIRKWAGIITLVLVAVLVARALAPARKYDFLQGDKYLGLWYGMFVGDGSPAPVPGQDVVPLPFGYGSLPKEQMDFGEWLPYTDPQDAPKFFDQLSQFFISDILVDISKNPALFPIADNVTRWANHKDAKHAIAEITGNGGKLPRPNIHWSHLDFTSDESLSHIAFAGIAARWLVVVNSTSFETLSDVVKKEAHDCGALFVSDFTDLSDFEVRKPFAPFGAALFIDTDGNPISIMHGVDSRVVRKDHKDWEAAKFLWRSTVLTGVTIIDHLVGVHLMAANLLTTASRELLPVDHPLRTFLTPFTYRSLIINHAAASFLTVEFGIIHHSTSFTGVGYMKTLHYGFMEVDRYFDLRTGMVDAGVLDEAVLLRAERTANTTWSRPILTERQQSWCSITNDLADYFLVVRDYIFEYIKLYYPSDAALRQDHHIHDFVSGLPAHKDHPNETVHVNSIAELATLLANFVSIVTGVHHLVGNVAEYLTDPAFSGTKVVPGWAEADQQTTNQGILIGVLTGISQPRLMGDWDHIYPRADQAKARELMHQFQHNLTKFSEDIENRNSRRRFPTDAINPEYMDSSVAV